MEIDDRPIRSEVEYDAALVEADALMDAVRGTPAGDCLEELVTRIQAYEARHWAIEA